LNLLFIVPYMPTPVRVRPYNLLLALARQGHTITLATLTESVADQEAGQTLSAAGITVVALPLSTARKAANLLGGALSRRPLQAAYCRQPALQRRLPALAAAADVVHVEHLRGAHFGLACRGHAPVVWDSVDAISRLFAQAAAHGHGLRSRLLALTELPRTRRYEAWLTAQFDQIIVTSEADGAALRRLRPDGAPVAVIPNGVDRTLFRPDGARTRAPETLVVTGKMSYHANVAMVRHLVENIMPHVWARRPAVRVQVVGQRPPRSIQALGADPRIEVTGEVPAVAPYLQQATLAVAPVVYGVGIQNKILEAMACGTPVVTSARAVGALAARPGRDIVVANTAEAFGVTILDLLANPARRLQVGRAGQAYVTAHHDWDRAADRLTKIYEQQVAARTKRAPL
jgi:glycosyltransferase involved in cell wall biosynthesis